jgi:hypothetical protein
MSCVFSVELTGIVGKMSCVFSGELTGIVGKTSCVFSGEFSGIVGKVKSEMFMFVIGKKPSEFLEIQKPRCPRGAKSAGDADAIVWWDSCRLDFLFLFDQAKRKRRVCSVEYFFVESVSSFSSEFIFHVGEIFA